MKRILILCIGIGLHYVPGVVFGLGIEQVNAQVNRFANYTETWNNLNIEMIAVQGGTFMMGCTAEQGNDCYDDEKPAHRVTVSDFYIGKYEVTQAQWRAVMGTTLQQQRVAAAWPIMGEGDNYAMYYVNWDDAQEFIRRLNVATGKQYRLPTEAEWEFAARGGNNSRGFKYSGSNTVGNVAWYVVNGRNTTHPVGTKSPNELGIYDMSGNVFEWCNDWFGNYSENAQTDPRGPSSGADRLRRGGGSGSSAVNVRVSDRLFSKPDNRANILGFRLACSSFGLMTNAQDTGQLLMDALRLSEEGKYKESIELLKKNESFFTQENRLSDMYGSLSWYYLFTKDFTLSEQAVMKALEIDNTHARLKTNLAHAMLLQGKTSEAERIYNELANTIEDYDDTYTATLLNDFEKLEKANIVPRGIKKDFERIKTDINKIHQAIEAYKQFVYDLFTSDDYDEKAIEPLQPYISFLPEQHTLRAANILGNLGNDFYESGNYAKAEIFYLEVKNICEKVLGKEHPFYDIVINSLADLYYRLGDYSQAEKNLLEAKNIREKVLGKEHPDYVLATSGIGTFYYQLGDFIQAEKYFTEAKNIYEKIMGKEHPFYATALNNLGVLYNAMSKYAEAEKYHLEAKTIREKVIGKDHPDYAISINNLGLLYVKTGNYAEAEKYFLEAKNIWEKVLGKDHPDYAKTVGSMGGLYFEMGDYGQAEQYYLEAKNIWEKVLGKDHPDYATSLNNLGGLYTTMGNYAVAEKCHLEAKNIWEKVFGKDHPDYAKTVGSMGGLYIEMGDYSQAEQYYLEAQNIIEKALGKDHPDYAISVNNLGALYIERGDYYQAEKYYLEAKNIREKVLGKEHPDYAKSINKLGELYSDLGDYTQAEKYYLEAKNIQEKVLGKEHPDYANVLNNLGHLYFVLNNYVQTENYYLEATSILEKALGKEHSYYQASLNNLGVLYQKLGDFSKAEKYYLEAKNIQEKVLGKEHPSYATLANNIGMFFQFFGYYVQAENYYFEAKNIYEKVFGKSHPDYVIFVSNMSSLYQSMKDYEKAIDLHIEQCGLITKSVDTNFAFLSEQQRSIYWEKWKWTFIGSYALSWFHPVASVHSLNYNNTLFTKGLLLRTSNGIRDAIYSSGKTELISQYEQLGNLRAEISNLQQKDVFNKDYVQTLELRADSLDKAITLASQDYRDLKADISMTWQDVQKQLKTDEVAIEFVDFRLYDKQWTDSTMYAALVLRPGMDAPAWIPLCEQQQLESLLRTTVQNSQLQTENLYIDKGEKLYELIWQNLEKELTGVHTIYYSPAGLLHKIAFNALPADGVNVLLSDKYNLQLVSSTREIARLKQEKSASFVKEATVVYGGLTYDRRQLNKLVADNRIKQPNEQPSENEDRFVDRFRKRGAELPPADLRAGFSEWQHLPGTKVETEEIVKLLAEKRVPYQYFIEDKGTEESFKELNGTDTKVIFLGTHGFFLADIENKAVENLVQRLGGSREKPFENPLLRSGLIMSGANDQWLAKEYIMDDDMEDGILTADEISRLNLINTKLVVLSACETGLGDVKNSEGVFGLQRAFKLAGVESLIMSLWSVPDRATADLMTTFYELWLSGQTKQSAFKAAQQKVREKYPSPYFWAAFVMMD